MSRARQIRGRGSATAEDESSLVEHVAEGARAFGELAKRYRPALVRFCGSRAGLADAEEAAQDALAIAWQAVSQCRDLTRFKSWVWGIARHRCDQIVRLRVRHEPPASLEELRESALLRQALFLDPSMSALVAPDPLDVVLAEEGERDTGAEFWRQVAKLPTMQRQCVELMGEGKSSQEVAAVLGIRAATVRSHMRHARRGLMGLAGLMRTPRGRPSAPAARDDDKGVARTIATR